jgi:hypothetical protein
LLEALLAGPPVRSIGVQLAVTLLQTQCDWLVTPSFECSCFDSRICCEGVASGGLVNKRFQALSQRLHGLVVPVLGGLQKLTLRQKELVTYTKCYPVCCRFQELEFQASNHQCTISATACKLGRDTALNIQCWFLRRCCASILPIKSGGEPAAATLHTDMATGCNAAKVEALQVEVLRGCAWAHQIYECHSNPVSAHSLGRQWEATTGTHGGAGREPAHQEQQPGSCG